MKTCMHQMNTCMHHMKNCMHHMNTCMHHMNSACSTYKLAGHAPTAGLESELNCDRAAQQMPCLELPGICQAIHVLQHEALINLHLNI